MPPWSLLKVILVNFENGVFKNTIFEKEECGCCLRSDAAAVDIGSERRV
jgi:hypothetical protein